MEGHFKHNITYIKRFPNGDSVAIGERWDEDNPNVPIEDVYHEKKLIIFGSLKEFAPEAGVPQEKATTKTTTTTTPPATTTSPKPLDKSMEDKVRNLPFKEFSKDGKSWYSLGPNDVPQDVVNWMKSMSWKWEDGALIYTLSNTGWLNRKAK